jgi:hypothetical protein
MLKTYNILQISYFDFKKIYLLVTCINFNLIQFLLNLSATSSLLNSCSIHDYYKSWSY